MSHAVFDLITQHPENPVKETGLTTATDKTWTKLYTPEIRLHVHTTVQEDGTTSARFDGPLMEQHGDDGLRMAERAYPPTFRKWKLSTEHDVRNWFHTEVSNIVLGAFATYPSVLESSEERPLGIEHIPETVDLAYSVNRDRVNSHLVIGEFKRALIAQDQWQGGSLRGKGQRRLAQELRGYAHKYSCPQVLCFDGRTLLLLQFRAEKREDIKSPSCTVDCWVVPRQNFGGTPLRYSLYRFIVQGFRRCQGLWACGTRLNNALPDKRQFFDGVPFWKIKGRYHPSPWGHRRLVSAADGAFYWTEPDSNQALLTGTGSGVYDTRGFWSAPEPDPEPQAGQSMTHDVIATATAMEVVEDDDDLYSAD